MQNNYNKMVTTITIIFGSILLVLTITGILMNPFFRVPVGKKEDKDTADAEAGKGGVPVSVIMMANGDTAALERSLPLFLNQEYEPGFQVIVVTEKGNSQDNDAIKRFVGDPHIVTTFIPDTSRYISREKLGITLGVKAAANDWCILVDCHSYPASNHWLREISSRCTDGNNLVIGYSNYDKDSKSYMRFLRLKHFAYLWRECRKGTAYSANGANLAFRKADFIGNDGFRGNLDIIRGEYDFIVNKLAQKGRTAVVTSLEGSLIENKPADKQWHKQRIFYIHSCKHMQRSRRHKMWSFWDTLFLHLAWIATVCAIAFAAITSDYILLGIAIACILMLACGRIVLSKRAIKAFDADISAWRIIPLELSSVWHSVADRLRHFTTDSYDFTCHKI